MIYPILTFEPELPRPTADLRRKRTAESAENK